MSLPISKSYLRLTSAKYVGNFYVGLWWTMIATLMVSYQVLLKVNVSMKMIYFPGFSRILDSFVVSPNFNSIDIFFPEIIASLKSYNFPKMELIVMIPLLCFTTFFFLSWDLLSFSGFNPFFCYSRTWSSSLLLKKVWAWN